MTIRIINSEFHNNGKGIVANGKMDLEITGSKFIGNGKDIELYVEESSKITIDNIMSLDCKTDSISINTYNTTINEAKIILHSQQNVYNEEQIKQIEVKLDELIKSKDNPSKIKKILAEIYSVTKSSASSLLVAYLKTKFGW